MNSIVQWRRQLSLTKGTHALLFAHRGSSRSL